jgi:hypothetical protein
MKGFGVGGGQCLVMKLRSSSTKQKMKTPTSVTEKRKDSETENCIDVEIRGQNHANLLLQYQKK